MSGTLLLSDVWKDSRAIPNLDPWELRIIVDGGCLSYVVWHQESKEALFVDPILNAFHEYETLTAQHPDNSWFAILETHTHADHISGGPKLSEKLSVPIMMHESAKSSRVKFRIKDQTKVETSVGELQVIATPGNIITFIHQRVGNSSMPSHSESKNRSVTSCRK